MGEFNLHQLQNNHRVLTQEFIERLFSHAFLPHNESNSTDFPFYNINWQQSYLLIIFQHMSSLVLFSMIYCIIFRSMHFCMIKSCRSEKKLSTRSFKEANLNKFDESLTLTDWLKPLKTDYPHESYNRFIKEYSKQLHASFSIKCIKGKQMISLVGSSHLEIYKSEKWPL